MTDSSPAPAFHPLANLFPLIEGEAFAELVADIAARGLEDPIVLHEGKILDGRNRFRACQAAGVAPRFTIFGLAAEPSSFMIRAALAGLPLTDHEMRLTPIDLGELPADFTVAGVPGADALGYVISKNMHRRHLDASQRALVAARLATMRPGRPSEKAEISAISQREAAEVMKVDRASVQSARAVLDHGASELIEAVERGDIAVSAAADLSALPLEEQRRVIETADKRALGAVVKAVRAEKQLEKRERREARETGLAARQRALPEKRYGVIYADPEWRFEPYSRESGMDRAADNHYPTSPENDIVLRKVGDIAAKDCVLFLWATAPMLLSAVRVLQNWGFTYKTHWIWEKDRIGTGYWNRNQHELLLLGTRGDVPAPAMGDQWPSVIKAPVGEHSAKPEVFVEMIEAYFPNLPKIELNARRAQPGWDAWGLEAPEAAS
ncbi:N6-adenosine-specific RNA methylase IME4 [Kaistia soli DSM 19436]|uniref:N6-adenosine-specific RNA methylase IME4 n=1 Tax=Kaistia soli DSM 19436 TaxID=1122133 RepID=A0A1M4VDW9_9HYPH|nr:MT-A70 family methyltransferase [Kaistia soli]SHE67176.1 N6-adenosine-specific RNA methylase IME4 [Kaistia soli DSM 19436]